MCRLQWDWLRPLNLKVAEPLILTVSPKNACARWALHYVGASDVSFATGVCRALPGVHNEPHRYREARSTVAHEPRPDFPRRCVP